jgi:hypothetical protein
MKTNWRQTVNAFKTATLAIVLAAATLAAAEPAVPAVPAVLEPLKAKIDARHYFFKGPTLQFRAEEPLTEEQWKAIEGLGIRNVGTGGKGIDDNAIARLVKLDLEGLSLDGSTLTDDGCKYLGEMKSLKLLSVGHTTLGKNGFQGTGLAALKSATSLERLSFGGSSAGDAAMEAIGELTQLKEFSSWHTQRTQAGNLPLAKLTNLKALTIGQSLYAWNGKPRNYALDDSSLEALAKITSLESLTLMEARFTFAKLEQLKALTNLKTLRFDRVDVSPADVEKLQAVLSGVKIVYKPLSEQDRASLEKSLSDPSAKKQQ